MSVSGYEHVMTAVAVASGTTAVSNPVRAGQLSELEAICIRLTGTNPDCKIQYEPAKASDGFPANEAAFDGYDSISDSTATDRPLVASSEDMHFGGVGLIPAPYYRFRITNLGLAPVFVNLWVRKTSEETGR